MNFIIIIPCFNEFKRLPISEFLNWNSKDTKVQFHFVNDGSTDDTILLLQKLHQDQPEKFTFLDLKINQGKAEAIRLGIQSVSSVYYDYIGFLDADLSSPLNEINNLIELGIKNKGKKIVFASRIQLMHNKIERSFFRHIIGRVFSTIVSLIFKLKIYDTQCGFKLYSKDLSLIFIRDKFISSWLFDIEIFLRIIKKFGLNDTINFSYEIPVQEWVEKGNSKIKFSYYLRAPIDLFKIYKFYK